MLATEEFRLVLAGWSSPGADVAGDGGSPGTDNGNVAQSDATTTSTTALPHEKYRRRQPQGRSPASIASASRRLHSVWRRRPCACTRKCRN